MAARGVNADGVVPTATDRYDLLLAAIPLAFALGALAAAADLVTLETGLTTGGVLGAVATGYALFGAPPTDDLPRTRGPTR